MLFNSIQFILFFIVVTLAYFSLNVTGRWVLLLAASCYFYMVFKPAFILILAFTIVIDYLAGLWIEAEKNPKKRRWWLIISIISNVGILAFFKYYDFGMENFNRVFGSVGLFMPQLGSILPESLRSWMVTGAGAVVLPIGLSFHTFQAMSYTIEVYRGNQKAERHFGIYALYVMFYPQLVAGPIERPQNVLHQFHTYFKYDFENVKAGLMQMAFGFFKKCVIADRLGLVVQHAYHLPRDHNGLTLLVATFFYTFVIYCDFSGYSDIAIGAARVMGYNLMENFRTPYFSKSITEFWGRWHISLSTWFRDYLYIPLGGNRKGEMRGYANRMLVFLVSGLWHGASWKFVIWGGLHGGFLLGESLRNKYLQKMGINLPEGGIYSVIKVFVTFTLVMLAWVFFRVEHTTDAFVILRKIAHVSFSDELKTPLNAAEMWFCVFLIIVLQIKEYYYLYVPTKNTAVFYTLFIGTLVLTYFFGVFGSNQFIYFQF